MDRIVMGDGWNGATVTYTIDGVDNVFGISRMEHPEVQHLHLMELRH
jgi:hypothetical protein